MSYVKSLSRDFQETIPDILIQLPILQPFTSAFPIVTEFMLGISF